MLLRLWKLREEKLVLFFQVQIFKCERFFERSAFQCSRLSLSLRRKVAGSNPGTGKDLQQIKWMTKQLLHFSLQYVKEMNKIVKMTGIACDEQTPIDWNFWIYARGPLCSDGKSIMFG